MSFSDLGNCESISVEIMKILIGKIEEDFQRKEEIDFDEGINDECKKLLYT